MREMRTYGVYRSKCARNDIAYTVYAPPLGEVKAIVQISHGMCDYIGRYEELAFFLNARGILVCGNDHLGHGKSVTDPADYGYFAHENGWTYLAKDLHQLTEKMQKEYPEVPYFLLGHSMGSFAVRQYLTQWGNQLDGAILLGTAGQDPLVGMTLLMAKVIGACKGERYRSTYIQNKGLKIYNERLPKRRTDFDWISRDEAEVDRYMADSQCQFIFTAKGFEDLATLLKQVSGEKWAMQVPKDLPILLLSGDADPVGAYGEGVREVYQWLLQAGVVDLDLRLYPGARHELVHETNKEEVFRDIAQWLDMMIHLEKEVEAGQISTAEKEKIG